VYALRGNLFISKFNSCFSFQQRRRFYGMQPGKQRAPDHRARQRPMLQQQTRHQPPLIASASILPTPDTGKAKGGRGESHVARNALDSVQLLLWRNLSRDGWHSPWSVCIPHFKRLVPSSKKFQYCPNGRLLCSMSVTKLRLHASKKLLFRSPSYMVTSCTGTLQSDGGKRLGWPRDACISGV